MTNRSSGTGRGPITRPGVTLIGRNHTWSAPMTDMQREMAEPPLEHVRIAAAEPWWVSLLLAVALPIGGFGWALFIALLVRG